MHLLFHFERKNQFSFPPGDLASDQFGLFQADFSSNYTKLD